MIKNLKILKNRYFDKGYFFKLWFKDNKNNNKKLEYKLNSESVFFELGGYKGDYSQDIISHFNPNIYIFEPDNEFYEILNKRFIKNEKVKIYNAAVSDKTEYLMLNRDGESSSIGNSLGSTKIKVKGILLSDFIKNNNIQKIDLLNMNIEGSEYVVLKELIKNNQINKIESIQIQFHRNKIFYRLKRKVIHFFLKKTHKLIWSYDFVWERWDKI